MTKYLSNIINQPSQLTKCLEHTFGPGSKGVSSAAEMIKSSKHVFITAIGASWNAGVSIQATFNQQGIHCVLYDASDFLYFTRIPSDSLVIFLSRSGQSVEVIKAIPKCRSFGASIVSITNAADSFLAMHSDVCLLTHVEFDHSISVSTYTSIVLIGQLLALSINQNAFTAENHKIISDCLQSVKVCIPKWRKHMESLSNTVSEFHTYFLARHASMASGHEGMLLWEEAAKRPASVLTLGTFRHGPQEIINNQINVISWLDNGATISYDVSLINGLFDRFVNTITIGTQLPQNLRGAKIMLPAVPDWLLPVINIIPVQLLAAKIAEISQEDPDSFRFCNYIVSSEEGLF